MTFSYFPSVKCLNFFVCNSENLLDIGNVHENDNNGRNNLIGKLFMMVTIMIIRKMILNLVMFMENISGIIR